MLQANQMIQCCKLILYEERTIEILKISVVDGTYLISGLIPGIPLWIKYFPQGISVWRINFTDLRKRIGTLIYWMTIIYLNYQKIYKSVTTNGIYYTIYQADFTLCTALSKTLFISP